MRRNRSWGRRILGGLVLALLSAGAGEARAQDPVEAAGCARLVDYSPAAFRADSHVVDHELLPLKPELSACSRAARA
jgi:hypothetical protein